MKRDFIFAYLSCGWFTAVVEIADAFVVDTTVFSVVVVAMVVVGAWVDGPLNSNFLSFSSENDQLVIFLSFSGTKKRTKWGTPIYGHI